MLQEGPALVTQLKALAGERIEVVRRAMEAGGYDLLVVASPENVLYATGFESMGATINRRYNYAALVTKDEVLMVVPAADFAPAIDAGIMPDRVYTFGKFFFSGATPSAHLEVRSDTFEGALRQALGRLNPASALAERAYLSGAALSLLATGGGEVADAAPWMLALRGRKLPLEIELLRHATRMTERAIEAGIAAAAIGVTDKEVASVVASHMALAGGLPRNVTVVGGLRSALADAMSTERRLEPGDLLRFDVGCSFYGYKSDMARTAVIGEPTRLQAKRYDALLHGLHVAIEKARVGARASDIFEAGVRAVEERGLRPYRRQHLGHAIGMAVYENPVVTPESGDVLRPDSTFCLETPYYEPGWGGMMVEDTGLVTEGGFELFSTIDRSLRIVSA
jgi:Xaa-Pro aminopeptidase